MAEDIVSRGAGSKEQANQRFAVTRCWMMESGANPNPSLSTCQPVDTHRRLTSGG